MYVARQYEDQFDYEIEWLYPRSLLGRLLSNVSFNSAAMAGAPLAIVIAFVRVVKMLVGRDNRFNPKRSYEKLGLSG